jgi:hypothetical protein
MPNNGPTELTTAAAKDLRTMAEQLEHWSAGRHALVTFPPEQFGPALRNIAKDVKRAVDLFYGPDEVKRLNRRYNGGKG